MSLGIAILIFFILENLLSSFPGTLSAHFVLAIFGSGTTFLSIQSFEKAINARKDNPSNIKYELPVAQTFSIILSTLKTLRFVERRWAISEIDRNHYSITAFSEWHDHSWRKNYSFLFDEPLFRQVKLQIFMRRQGYRVTELSMLWSILSPLTRTECNDLQNYTSQVIANALRRAETEHAKKFKVFN